MTFNSRHISLGKLEHDKNNKRNILNEMNKDFNSTLVHAEHNRIGCVEFRLELVMISFQDYTSRNHDEPKGRKKRGEKSVFAVFYIVQYM